MRLVILAIFMMIAVAMATSKEMCIAWKQTECQINNDCCRGLRCKFDTKQCVPIGGILLPGLDKRPLGPGPYPPNVKV